MSTSRLLLLLFLLAPSTALAHPGHGRIPSEEPIHYLAEPLHVGIWLAVGLVLAVVVAATKRRRRARW